MDLSGAKLACINDECRFILVLTQAYSPTVSSLMDQRVCCQAQRPLSKKPRTELCENRLYLFSTGFTGCYVLACCCVESAAAQSIEPEDARVQQAVIPEHQPPDVPHVGRVRCVHLLASPKVVNSHLKRSKLGIQEQCQILQDGDSSKQG